MIRWNELSVSEIMTWLARTKDAMNTCNVQIEAIRSAFSEANPDNQNEVMTKLLNRFEEKIVELKKIETMIEDSEIAIRKTNERFTELEASLCARANNIESGSVYDIKIKTNQSLYLDWDNVRYQPSTTIITSIPMSESFMEAVRIYEV